MIEELQRFDSSKLKRLSGGRIPATWVFIDTETVEYEDIKGKSQRFKIGWICLYIRDSEGSGGVEKWSFFSNEIKFCKAIELIVNDLGDIILCGHNIFFDLQACGFYYYFTKWNWQLTFYYDRGMTYILKCEKGTSKVTILSTTNWFDQSLKYLGDALGLEKLEVDFESASSKQLKEYCRRDVEIIVRAMKYYIDFIIDNDLGRFSLTKASQAFSAFRHRFMSHDIFIHKNSEVINLERNSYMGGRCEAFFIGKVPGEDFITLDVNSMYPYVMKKYDYPYRLIQYRESVDIEQITDTLKNFCVIAEIEVSTHEPCFAMKHQGKTIFPVGEFTCFVTSEGLRYAIENKYVKRIIRASVYRKANLFSLYVDYFYDLRKKYDIEGNDIMALLCKYLLNNLYGKFAQLGMTNDIEQSDEGHKYYREEILDMVRGRMIIKTHIMNKILTQYQEGEGDNSFVGLAAHITENARFVLWDIIKKAGKNKVLYCDTDSVKIRKKDLELLNSFIDPGRLGSLKIENESKTLTIGGAKNYRTEKSRKIKGIPISAKEIRPGTFEYDSFKRQVSHLRDSHIVGAKIEKMTRSLKHNYDKGIVLKCGRVIPFHFPLPTQPGERRQ